LAKKILRLKLTDFINTNIEDSVIHFLHLMKESTPTFVVHCWYKKEEMDSASLFEFKQKYLEYLDIIEMSFDVFGSNEEAVWYDIINAKDDGIMSHYKFKAVYENTDDIINCIIEFNNVIKFDTQKSMGYNKHGYNKDAKDSNNRFKKMGR